jgi:hypothetical protein
MLNRADECRQRADECRNAAQLVADDVLRGAYLDLARRWRKMAQQAQQKELKSNTATTPPSRDDLRSAFPNHDNLVKCRPSLAQDQRTN